MSFGRREEEKSNPLDSVPVINRVEYNTPLGDRVISDTRGGTQRVRTFVSPQTQRILDTSRSQVDLLSQTLGQVTPQRAEQVRQRGEALFGSLADTINRQSEETIAEVRSDNARRFGGSMNATFGNELIGRLEGERQRNLGAARLQADLTAEDLIRQDESDVIRRLGVFSNLMQGVATPISQASLASSNALESAQSLAQQRALALENSRQQQERQQMIRQESLNNLLRTSAQLIPLFI